MRKLTALLAALILLASCKINHTSQPKTELVIFAASSLTNAFDEMTAKFEAQHPDVKVVLNFASSSQLAAQLLEGAQADIFASANPIQMQNVVDAGLLEGQPVTFAKNQLVLLVPKENPAQISGLADLANPGISLILASPSTPVRVYSDQVIQNYSDAAFAASVYQNLASEEANVRQVVTKIALGEGDVGIVYASDLTPDISELVLSIPIPPEINVPADYPIAQLGTSTNPELAKTFIQFVLSAQGQEILGSWGFIPKDNL